MFWVLKLCLVAIGYERFRGPCCLHLQGEVTGGGENGIDIGLECKRTTDGCLKLRYPDTSLHDVTTQKTSI
jgi:hypothetical protein